MTGSDVGPSSAAGSYAGAGVDISAGDRAVALMRGAVARTTRPEVVGDLGGFAGLFDASALAGLRRPLLATSTDGVGTKVVIAQWLGRYDTIGVDLVAMVADDVVACGAEPLFMTDYLVFGKVIPQRVAAVVAGIADGCVQAGCALVGGETAEHPGHLTADAFDMAGAATGVVDADAVLGAHRVRPGDAVLAMASSGLHANGFSLVRSVLEHRDQPLEAEPAGLGQPLGEALLTPSRIYACDCLALARGCDAHAFAHVTGGGLAANLARVLPPDADAVLERGTWSPPAVFGWLNVTGGVPADEMERVFNMGVGMVAVVAADDAERALALLTGRGVKAWALGRVTEGTGRARLTGTYAH
jgi:phosphoribosylformylglycinamidine cyclo-ligase